MPLKMDIKKAAIMAENLRSLVESHQYSDNVDVTISLGVAQYHAGESSQEWISRADTALYQAKKAGRNKICLAN